MSHHFPVVQKVEPFGEEYLYFHIMHMKDSLFTWMYSAPQNTPTHSENGRPTGQLSSLAMAIPTKYVSCFTKTVVCAQD